MKYFSGLLLVLSLVSCIAPPENMTPTATAVSSTISPLPTATRTLLVTAVPTNEPTNQPATPTPNQTPTPDQSLALASTLILCASIQDDNWALKTYPHIPAFSEDVFGRFYGPVSRMEDVRMYTRFNFGPQLSPNGRYLLLPGVGGYGGDNTGLWFVNLQTDEARQLLNRPKAATWSPYGDQITYVEGDTLYTLSVTEGAEPQPQFTHPNLWGLYARWSPDGQYVATMTTVQNQPDESGSPELQNTYWLVSVYDQSAVELAERADYPMEYAAEEMAWSPTGRHLLVRNQVFDLDGRQLSPAFSGRAIWLPLPEPLQIGEQEQLLVNGRDGLVIMTIDGEETARITDAFVDDWAFSHNDRSLAYTDPHNKANLIIFDLETQEKLRLGSVPVDVQSLQWGGNDEYLLLDDGSRASPIWALPIHPDSQVQIVVEEGTLIDALPLPVNEVAPATAVPIPTLPPDWEPPQPSTTNGFAILFARDDDLWRADMSGEQVEPITESGSLDWGMTKPGDDWRVAALSVPPQVSPNGRWIAFSPDGWTLSLVDVNVPNKLRRINPGAPIPAWSPDSRYLAFGADSGLYIYDVEMDNLSQLLDIDQVANVVWSPDMRYLAFACCFVRPEPYSTADFGEIRQVEIATGQAAIIDATTLTIGGGTPPICWNGDGQVIEQRGIEAARCSFAFSAVNSHSPDGSQFAATSPSSPSDDFWEGDSLLTIQQSDTNEIVWQRRISGHAATPRWSPDGAYIIFQRGAAWKNNLSVWRISADGTAEPELIIEDGCLLDVIPQWQP